MASENRPEAPVAGGRTRASGGSDGDAARGTGHGLDFVMRPDSVAVVGASRQPASIGWQIFHNLLSRGFTGRVYPVNPSATSVHSVRAHPSVGDLPEVPDLAVIAVPKEHVVQVAEECGREGVRGLVVVSAGFREVGGAGVERERRLVEVVERHGMRMVGPNCMGVLNTAADVSMNATFAPAAPPRGGLAFMSQSGAMGITILDYAAEWGIGISQFVSVGNKPDVSGNDLLEYWGEDPGVDVVLMYLENFGDPRRFTRLARETTRRKPVIAVKAGRSRAGARAASSHTGALSAMDVATDALFAQCGVLRVDTVEELFDAAMAFGNAPLPDGPRVAILTNAGGPGIIIADACEARGLEVAPLADETRGRLREVLVEEASVANPVDMIASATAEDYREALEIVLDDPAVNAVIAAFVPPMGIEPAEVTRAIRDVMSRAGSRKPVLAVLMGREGVPAGMAELREARLPGYIFPESAARALAAMYRYRQWLERPDGEIATYAVDEEEAARIVRTAVEEGRERLSMADAFRLLQCYGIPVARHGVASDAEEAIRVADEIGYPVVLKAVAPAVIHKTEVGGVQLDLESPDEVAAAYDEIVTRMQELDDAGDDARGDGPGGDGPGDSGTGVLEGVLVQEMIPGGRETIVGMTLEANFGALIMFGLGGVYVEALGDVTFRVQPVTDVDAHEMIRGIRGRRLLEGVRGEPPVDMDRLADVIQRVSQMVGAHPEIREMDLNPFLAFPEGEKCTAVDVRVMIAEPGRNGAEVAPPEVPKAVS